MKAKNFKTFSRWNFSRIFSWKWCNRGEGMVKKICRYREMIWKLIISELENNEVFVFKNSAWFPSEVELGHPCNNFSSPAEMRQKIFPGTSLPSGLHRASLHTLQTFAVLRKNGQGIPFIFFLSFLLNLNSTFFFLKLDFELLPCGHSNAPSWPWNKKQKHKFHVEVTAN